ncbi:Ref family recombination enhancement nuclease [Cupriavidus gilardii]|uniref:Ref family recombination enhancement nuclease n=1 Tax=Cupriavidus gilardii TaxID=82541 RepID=UPI003B8A7D49
MAVWLQDRAIQGRKGRVGGRGVAKRKATLAERRHMAAVASLGCIVDTLEGNPGVPAEIHHIRTGTGAGLRASHLRVLPLCPLHHRGRLGIHGPLGRGFVAHLGLTELDLLALVERALELQSARAGAAAVGRYQ